MYFITPLFPKRTSISFPFHMALAPQKPIKKTTHHIMTHLDVLSPYYPWNHWLFTTHPQKNKAVIPISQGKRVTRYSTGTVVATCFFCGKVERQLWWSLRRRVKLPSKPGSARHRVKESSERWMGGWINMVFSTGFFCRSLNKNVLNSQTWWT